MKKLTILLALLALLSAMAAPAFADDNSHQSAQVLEITEGVTEEVVFHSSHLKDEQMMEVVRSTLETEEGKALFPEDAHISHLTMIRQRNVTGDGGPIQLSLRSWGGGEDRYLVVLFKPLGEEAWTIVAAAQGEFIDATLPGDGQYALSWSWD